MQPPCSRCTATTQALSRKTQCGWVWAVGVVGVEVTCVGRYVAAVYGLRVQKIGPHYRVYKKVRHCSGIAAWAPHALNDVGRARCT